MSFTIARCWVALDRNGRHPNPSGSATPFGWHYPDAGAVQQDLRGWIEDYGPNDLTGVRPVALPSRCLSLTCDGCPAAWEDPDGGYVLHIQDEDSTTAQRLARVREEATEAEWRLTSDADGAESALCGECVHRQDQTRLNRELTRRVARILITGSPDWDSPALITGQLDALKARAERVHSPGILIVHGACPTGADAVADAWARLNAVPVEPHPADWATYGPAAEAVRNAHMVATGADACLAFILNHSPEAIGCAELASDRGIRTYWFCAGRTWSAA